MELIRRVQMMREVSREARSKGRKLAFVPTMGSLHDGHLSLVRRSRELADLVVASIFVNPKQFGPSEDFDQYPRDLARDADLCLQEGVDYLFAPEPEDIYPSGFRTAVEVMGLSTMWEGTSRPGHFNGVATVVLKLFNVVRPHFAFFGQKDFQQTVVLKRMVRDLNLDVEMVICPTVRHEDGLAMSSRNAYLAPEQRKAATVLFRALEEVRMAVEERGLRDPREAEAMLRRVLEAEPLARVDYAAIVNPEDLERLERIERECVGILAVHVGPTRLIDNMVMRPVAQTHRAAEVEVR